MTNIFNVQPDLMVHMTSVRAIQAPDGGTVAIAFDQNIFRPAGGGQPFDRGRVTIGDACMKVVRVAKEGGNTWVLVDAPGAVSIEPGEIALLEVDAEHRHALSRSHSLTHLMMAAARRVSNEFNSKGASIDEDGRRLSVKFQTSTRFTNELVSTIDGLTRHFVLQDAAVQITSARSVEAAAQQYPYWRMDAELGLSGKIRVVEIVGIDANPCSGSHVKTTEEIGPFKFASWTQHPDGTVELLASLCASWTYWFGESSLVDPVQA